MELQEVPADVGVQRADVVQAPPAVDLVGVHEVAAGLDQEGVRMDLVVVAELGREEVHRDLTAVREDRPVQAEALRMV